MTKRMLVDATHPEETRVAIVKDSRLEDFDFENTSKKQLKGNIYLAKVVRIEPSLQAAFVEYGGNRHGFLPFSEIHPDYFRIPVADRPNDEENWPENEVEAESDIGISEEAYAEEIKSYQAEQSEMTAHEHDHTHDLHEASEGPTTQPAAVAENHYAEETQTVAVSGETTESSAPPTMSGFGAEADNELGLITDFGNAAVDPGFVPTPMEVISTAPAEEEERTYRQRRPNYKIQEVVKRRQVMLVQVVKEERGNKGAALTTFLSLAGRYCVLMPNTDRGGGVSRKITSHQDRKRMKEILDQLDTPEGMAVILRTAGMEQETVEIQRDLEYLLRLWNNIREHTLASTAPTLIYEEANLIKRCLRDLYSADVSEILVAGQKGYDLAREFMSSLMTEDSEKVRLYQDTVPLFFRSNVEKQIDQLYNPVVQLRSGGYIVINPTEALVSIDVNSGRATRERHIEGTALKTNLEAADEVARQLRLRDLAGLVVIDFIDMEDGRNNAAVERRMKEAMKADRARLQIGRISPFGLMELSRQRLHPSLTEINFERCEHCAGLGLVRSVDSSAISILRMIEEEGIRQPNSELVIHVATKVVLYILNQKRAVLHDIERRYSLQVLLHSDDSLVPPLFRIERGHKGGERASRAAVDSDQILADNPAAVLNDQEDGQSTGGEMPVQPRAEGDRLGNRRGGGRSRGRNRDRDRSRDRNAPQGERKPHEANGNAVPQDAVPEDNIGNEVAPDQAIDTNGNVNGGEGQENRHNGGRPQGERPDGERQGGRRRGRRGGRGRRPWEDRGDKRPENSGDAPAPQGDHRQFEPAAEIAAPRPHMPQAPQIPRSIHDIDTTPREERGMTTRQAASAPPPSPYEETNPTSANPKGGWWRKLTGQ